MNGHDKVHRTLLGMDNNNGQYIVAWLAVETRLNPPQLIFIINLPINSTHFIKFPTAIHTTLCLSSPLCHVTIN